MNFRIEYYEEGRFTEFGEPEKNGVYLEDY
jgi:hypothetical protein